MIPSPLHRRLLQRSKASLAESLGTMTGTDTLPVVHVGTIVEMTSPPTRSPEQREAAREKAAEARRLRAEIKDRLKMGLLNFEELMAEADSNEIVGKMKVLAALESLPRLGKVKARRNGRGGHRGEPTSSRSGSQPACAASGAVQYRRLSWK
jgi:hypothetical protein